MALPASAQQSAPRTTDAGQIEKRIDDAKRKAAESERGKPDVVLPGRTSEPKAVREEAEAPFVLSAVNVNGATVYEVADFAPLYEEFIGRRVTPAELENVIERISAKYERDGYFLSYAEVPPQDLSFGIVTINVTEGYIDEVNFRGAPPGRASMFANWAGKIKASVPAHLPTVERYLLLMSDIPGLTATPSLEEVEGVDGAYRMTITLTHDKADAYTSLDNRGTHPVGPLQLALSAGMNSVFGALERVRASAFVVPDEPEELRYGEVYGQIPVGNEGTQLFVSASRSLVDIYSESRGSQLQSRGDRYSIGGWHPVIREQELALYLNARFDYNDSRQSALNDNYLDRLRVGRIGGRFWFKDEIGGSTTTSVWYSRGFDILGASPLGYNVSRTDGESRFSKVAVDINRLQRITDDFWADFNASGMHSKNVLLSAEEFAVGGATYGRGYDPSEISDSRGVAGSLELRHRLPVDEGLLSHLWLYTFFDGGVVWRVGNTKDSLVSTGVGMRFFPIDGVRATLEYAKPLTRIVAEEGDTAGRVFFSIALEF